MIRRLAALAVLTSTALLVPGCAETYGVDVQNKTGQILNVTMFDVASDGTTKTYMATTLVKNGSFTNQLMRDQYGFGKRVRFSIPDRGADDPTSNVELKLSDERVRDYDLVVVNGRLVAKEHTKGRPENRPSE